jgi:Zn-dependent peptidase ImmA (M78 family)
MNRKAYYRTMQALALEVRKRHGLRRADISIKQMWRVYRAEGIERIDFWPNLRHIRVAYFNDECGVSVMIAKGLPDELTIFSMAHELKHHLVDRDLMVTLCGPTDNAVIADDRNAIEFGPRSLLPSSFIQKRISCGTLRKSAVPPIQRRLSD